MPAIFAASCEACGHASEWVEDEWTGWRSDDGQIQVLPHPGEFDELMRAGVNIRHARLEGRILLFSRAVCDNCAAIRDVPYGDAARDAHTSWGARIGFGIVIVAGATVGVYGAVIADMPWFVTLVLAPVWLICGVLVGFMAAVYLSEVRNRFRTSWKITKRQTPLPPAKLRCETCLTGGLYHLSYIAGRRLRCPSCGQPRYVFASVAVS